MSTRPKVMMASNPAACQARPGLGTVAVRFPAGPKPVLTQPEIRRDTVRVLRAVAADTHLLFKAAECLPSLTHAALVIRASRDRARPPEHLKESLVKDPRPWRWCRIRWRAQSR
jgi:hypothetical protein